MNEPIKTAMTAKELMMEHRKADPTSPPHWITVKHAVLAAEQYASQQTAELQREVERVTEVLQNIANQSHGGNLVKYKGQLLYLNEYAKQALKDQVR